MRGTGLAVPESIQFAKRFERTLEDAVATLFVDIGFEVARERGDDLDVVFGEEGGEIGVAGRDEDREVAAVDDAAAERAGPGDKPTERGVHLGSAAGDVERADRGPPEQIETGLGQLGRETFAAVGAGIDVAVSAGLIAEFADIHLQDVDACGAGLVDTGLVDLVQKSWRAVVSFEESDLRARVGPLAARPQERELHGTPGDWRSAVCVEVFCVGRCVAI